MAFVTHRLLYILVLMFINCTQRQTQQKSITNEQNQDEYLGGHPINYDKIEDLGTVYVIKKNGAEYKEDPNENSKTLGVFKYGEDLTVIEFAGEWLGVVTSVERTKPNYKTSRWEKVYIRKSLTSNQQADVVVTIEDLNTISSIEYKDGTFKEFETGKKLDSHFEISFTSREQFLKMKKTAINYIIKDTSLFEIKNDSLIINTEQKKVVFTDTMSLEDDAHRRYSYLGFIPKINEHIVGISGYESQNFMSINNITGVEKWIFYYPYLTNDGKYIISLETDVYSEETYLVLHSTKNLKHGVTIRFKNWAVSLKEGDMFWGEDNYFYAKAQNMTAFFQNSNIYQYIRIKIL